MANKSIIKKTKSPKNRVSATVISEVAKCRPSTVNMVLRGERSSDTVKGQKIQVAKILLEEGFEKLIVNAKKSLNN